MSVAMFSCSFAFSETVPVDKSLPGHDYLESCQKMVTTAADSALDDEKSNPMVEALKEFLNSEIIGQESGVDGLADAMEMLSAFLNDPEKPIGRFFFMGPTGVGKTELVRALVRYLKGNPDTKMIRFDGGELQMDHEISRLKGTTSGFKGYGDKPGLHPENLEAVRLKFTLNDGSVMEFSIVLFDEIEKMSDAAFKYMLGILDNGMTTLGDNTKVDMRKTLIIATSNLGAKEVEQLIEARKTAQAVKRATGQKLTEVEEDLTGRVDLEFRKEIENTYMAAIAKRFAPEFKNRWQKFIQFLHLEKTQYLKIIDVMLAKLQKRIFQRTKVKFDFQLTPKAKEYLVDKGTDFRNGARELGNLLEFQMVRRFARLLATNQIKQGDVLLIDVAGEGKSAKLVFKKVAAGLDEDQLKTFADKVYPGKKMKEAKFSTGDEQLVEDKSLILARVLKELNGLPKGINHLFTISKESIHQKDNVATENSGDEPIVYKIIHVDEVPVRIWASARELPNPGGNGTSSTVNWNIEIAKGMSEKDKFLYTGKGVYSTSISALEKMVYELKQQAASPEQDK